MQQNWPQMMGQQQGGVPWQMIYGQNMGLALDAQRSLYQLMAQLAGNDPSGSALGAYGGNNDPTKFNLGGAIGNAYSQMMPLHQINSNTLQARYGALGEAQAAREQRRGIEAMAGAQERSALGVQESKSQALRDVLNSLGGLIGGGQFRAPTTFRTNYGAGVY